MTAVCTAVANIVAGDVHIPRLDYLPDLFEDRVGEVFFCGVWHLTHGGMVKDCQITWSAHPSPPSTTAFLNLAIAISAARSNSPCVAWSIPLRAHPWAWSSAL